MKIFAIFTVILATTFSASADPFTFEQRAPHFPTNAPIIWQAPTNHLPKSLWIYKRLPNIFPATTISNAIILASLQDKGFPAPSTNEICMDFDNCPCGHPCTFAISPKDGSIIFSTPNFDHGSTNDIPSDTALIKWAWEYAAKLGVDRTQLLQKPPVPHACSYDETGHDLDDQHPCSRVVFLSRLVDGIPFKSNGDNGWVAEGFCIQFGSHGKIRFFSLIWPKLERDRNSPIIRPDQIIHCIRAHRIIVIPEHNETNYFARVKSLSTAQKLTITKVTPFYLEGSYGEDSANDQVATVTPVAELEAVADLGVTNLNLRLFCPITVHDLNRVLKLP